MHSSFYTLKLDKVKLLVLFIMMSAFMGCGSSESNVLPYSLDSNENLEFINVRGEYGDHLGKTGLKVFVPGPVSIEDDYETMVLLKDTDFRNGIIEIELAGEAVPGVGPAARGFVGVAFRINSENPDEYECLYLRPLNGRAEHQIQRNHSVQYISHPDYPWWRLREETPGFYESYVDLIPGEWTKVRIEVSGQSAKLYVNGAEQPTLVINDLKRGDVRGGIGLWLHSSTIAHYRNLVITPELSLKK